MFQTEAKAPGTSEDDGAPPTAAVNRPQRPRIRPHDEFDHEPGVPIEVAPQDGYRGCYLFRHDATPGATPPDTYTLVLYVDKGMGPVKCVVPGERTGFVVDVPEGFKLSELNEFVSNAFRNRTPGHGGPGGPAGPVKTSPPGD